MDNNQSKLDAKLNARPRVAYTTPSLTVYGEIRDLTAGGSGATMETNNGGVGCMGRNPDRNCIP